MSREAMKQALKALELALDSHGVLLLSDPPQDPWKTRGVESKCWGAITALRAALDAPEPEPVAWRYRGNLHEFDPSDWAEEPVTALYQSPQSSAVSGFVDSKLNPIKHKWVGLTDEEIKEIVGPWGDTPIKGYTRKLFDQIEAKLKEKNT